MNNNMHYKHILHAVRITNNAEPVEEHSLAQHM